MDFFAEFLIGLVAVVLGSYIIIINKLPKVLISAEVMQSETRRAEDGDVERGRRANRT